MASTTERSTIGSAYEMADPHHRTGTPLISLHLASNNPQKFVGLMENLETTTANPLQLEVLVKVDSEDVSMQNVANAEAGRRPFAVRVVVAPRGAGFQDLWQSYNLLYARMHPGAYFVSLFNDEVRIVEHGWDNILLNYRGFFPDDIFRLRVTRLKLRNYYDFWECGYAPDCFAFHTRRWLQAGEGWCPCTGPDSSQQFIAYYLGMTSYPSVEQCNRDVPIFDISLTGEGASEEMTDEQRHQRSTTNFRLWFTTVSHAMQEELRRRAALLRANIDCSKYPNQQLSVVCDSRRRIVRLVNQAGETLEFYSYNMSRWRLWLQNAKRTLNYRYYAGGGDAAWNIWPISFLQFLTTYYPGLRRLLRPLLDSPRFWVLQASCGLIARAIRRRNMATLRYEFEEFCRRHEKFDQVHPQAHKFLSNLARILLVIVPSIALSTEKRVRRVLVSFQLASKYPEALVELFDNLEQRATDPTCFEILVKIDIEDPCMRSALAAEVPRRKFRLRPLVTPRRRGYEDLWQALNGLYRLTDPRAYFVCNINDEVRNPRGWLGRPAAQICRPLS